MRYTEDGALPEVTDEMLERALHAVRPYTIVILKAGPKFEMPGPDRGSEVSQTIWRHGKRNFALHSAGLMPIVCPVADGSGITGVSVFDADPDEVHRIMSEDPGVKAEIFTYEVHPTRSFPGSALPPS